MRRPLLPLLTLLAPLLAAVPCAHADVCFTVLDGTGRVLHQSRSAPVDMSRPISETLYSRFPGASVMVFGTNNDQCPETRAGSARPAGGEPARARRPGRATM